MYLNHASKLCKMGAVISTRVLSMRLEYIDYRVAAEHHMHFLRQTNAAVTKGSVGFA